MADKLEERLRWKAPVLAFLLGCSVAWAASLPVRDRAHDRGVREGRISAAYDISFDGYMIYLGCLSDHCETEKQQSYAVVAAADKVLKKEGVK